MTLSKKQVLKKLEVDLENNTVSIRLDNIIEEDGAEISRQCHRCAFVPGEIEKVKEYLGITTGKEITFLKSLWSPAVVADYGAKIVLLNPPVDNNVSE